MYLLDTNIFVGAARYYYHFDIAPTFWTWIEDQHAKGNVASIPEVRDEIREKSDTLRSWTQKLPPSFWLQPTSEFPYSARKLTNWAVDPDVGFTPKAKDKFFSRADYFLVAAAMHRDKERAHTVVTLESTRPGGEGRILIPAACRAMGVPSENPFDVYRKLGLKM